MFALTRETSNKFGDICYSEKSLDGVWTIKNPSDLLIARFPEYEVRFYKGIKFLLSEKASNCLPKEGQGNGSAIIIEFEYLGETYVLYMVDNKPYVQLCQGVSIDNESFEDTIVRKLKEELNVSVESKNLTAIGEYSFADYNELIDFKRIATTKVFALKVDFQQVQHLFKDISGSMIISDVTHLKLDTTKYAIAINTKNLDDIPELIEEIRTIQDRPIRLGGHHLEIVRLYFGYEKKYDLSYLNTFELY